jgi:hypothetical protein
MMAVVRVRVGSVTLGRHSLPNLEEDAQKPLKKTTLDHLQRGRDYTLTSNMMSQIGT